MVSQGANNQGLSNFAHRRPRLWLPKGRHAYTPLEYDFLSAALANLADLDGLSRSLVRDGQA